MGRAPSLVTIARRALGARGEAALPRGGTVLVGVSGGPDSIALLDALARLREDLGLVVVAHGVDHGLRDEAGGELDLAEEVARARDVAFGRSRVSVARGGNVQARAREARYRALAQAAREAGAVALATAHHADDRAETVLLRLLRGAGATGLAVLPARAPLAPELGGDGTLALVRPLLRARRADVEAHVARHRLPYAMDPSNDDRRFLRARVRHEILPRLAELDPAIVPHLGALADELFAAREALASGRLGELPPLPRATQERLALILRGEAPPATELWLPGGWVVRRDPERARPRRR